MPFKILLAEDEALIGTMVKMNLEQEGFAVDWVTDGEQALQKAASKSFDLLIFDIRMPGRDGLELAREVRKKGIGTPILMLTLMSDTTTKVKALDRGADDYLTKPFDIAELLARVRALVRRSQADRQVPAHRIFRFGRYEINFETHDATSNEGRIPLSEKEVGLMELFVRTRGQVLSRVDMLEEVWGMDANPTDRTVDNFILRLRKLFEPDPERPRHILTVRGSGYRFEA
jgi:two-component system alkaline phosphatase synthesis response regulator PhoP